MRRLFVLGLLPLALLAESHWTQIRSGPFEIYIEGGSKHARETLGWFDQFRYVLGYMLGKQDLETERRVRIIYFKSAKERDEYPTTPAVIDGRDRWYVLLASEAPISSEVFRECARLLLENNSGRMPAPIEQGIADPDKLGVGGWSYGASGPSGVDTAAERFPGQKVRPYHF